MWLLEGDDLVLAGKKMWLRPGKKYLFGRTSSEPGQTVILDKTISRKHLTITVDAVPEKAALSSSTRSQLTIEDLNTKIGTRLNNEQIRGQQRVVSEDVVTIKMGHCDKLFRIKWHPIVFTFIFTSKELRADPIGKRRADLEQLDIKTLTEYDILNTTHVVAKKRNTTKGLQALINGRYIVAESFVEAVKAATVSEPGASCGLEADFEAHWPNALEHLPPHGQEPIDRPPELFAPDPARENIFDGYTFIFYDQNQYDALLAPITNGRGKALLCTVTPCESAVDDFILFVKSHAGEKGLGKLQDEDEKGVVVVRHFPQKGNVEWYVWFFNQVAVRLDHRPIDQREFLDAIVMKDAGVLRRRLEVEHVTGSATEPSAGLARPSIQGIVIQEPSSTMASATGGGGGGGESASPSTATAPAGSNATGSAMELDGTGSVPRGTPQEPPTTQESATTFAPRPRTRRAVRSRFKGFDEVDGATENAAFEVAAAPMSLPAAIPESQGLFVSQHLAGEAMPVGATQAPEPEPATTSQQEVVMRPHRKRPASSLETAPTQVPEPPSSMMAQTLLDDIAPATTAAKRRRIERGQDPTPTAASACIPVETAEPPQDVANEQAKKELDILRVARQNKEAAEARAEKERQDLAQVLDGVDLAEIRNLAIVEEVAVKDPRRRRGEELEDDDDQAESHGRWDARWNGRRNFKAFRKQTRVPDATTSVSMRRVRARPRTIIALVEAKAKTFGMGSDSADFWLENVSGPATSAGQSPCTRVSHEALQNSAGSLVSQPTAQSVVGPGSISRNASQSALQNSDNSSFSGSKRQPNSQWTGLAKMAKRAHSQRAGVSITNSAVTASTRPLHSLHAVMDSDSNSASVSLIDSTGMSTNPRKRPLRASGSGSGSGLSVTASKRRKTTATGDDNDGGGVTRHGNVITHDNTYHGDDNDDDNDDDDDDDDDDDEDGLGFKFRAT